MLASESNNLPRWEGQAGWHESYVLKITDPRKGVALWIRYVLVAPVEGDPFAELWGIAYNGAGRGKHIAIRETLPFELVRLDSDPFAFQVGRAILTNHGARGRIEDRELRLGWVLDWEPCEESFLHFPMRAFYDGAFPPTKILAPNPDLRVSGEVLFNRKRIELVDAPAIQEHMWGTRYSLGGVWAHCNTFVEEPGVIFEGFVDQPRKMGPLEPNLSVFRFVVDGEEYVANGVYQMLTTRSRYDTGGWFFEVTCGDRRFEGTIEAPFNRMVGLAYRDSDGQPVYGYHTKIADMTLRVFVKERGKWALERELTAPESCAFELISRAPDPDLPLILEEPAEA